MRKPAARLGSWTPTMEEWARWAVPKLIVLRTKVLNHTKGVKNIRIVNVDSTKFSELLSEFLNRLRVGLDLFVALLALTLLLDVESQILQKEDLAVLTLENVVLDLVTNTLGKELYVLGEELRELGSNGLERVFGVGGTVRSAKVRHEDDRLGA